MTTAPAPIFLGNGSHRHWPSSGWRTQRAPKSPRQVQVLSGAVSFDLRRELISFGSDLEAAIHSREGRTEALVRSSHDLLGDREASPSPRPK